MDSGTHHPQDSGATVPANMIEAAERAVARAPIIPEDSPLFHRLAALIASIPYDPPADAGKDAPDTGDGNKNASVTCGDTA